MDGLLAWIELDELYDMVDELQAEVARLKSLNHQMNLEYNKTWDVLRTYNPKDTELEYIGFETVEVVEA